MPSCLMNKYEPSDYEETGRAGDTSESSASDSSKSDRTRDVHPMLKQ